MNRVSVALGEGVDVALVPGGLLPEEDLDDVELELGGGLKGGRLGAGGGGEGEKKEEEGKRGKARWDGHGTSGSWSRKVEKEVVSDKPGGVRAL
jgi:hypothetical protein